MPWFKSHKQDAKQVGSSHESHQEPVSNQEHESSKESSAQAERDGEAGPSVIVGDGQGSSQGTEEVLITIPSAIAHLIDGNESAHLATGPFSLVRLAQNGNGIAVFARVGDDLQWPLVKDAPTAKLDNNHYFFTLRVPPDVDDEAEESTEHGEDGDSTLNYGITFLDDGGRTAHTLLDKLLEQYSHLSSPQVVQGDPEREAKGSRELTDEEHKGRLDRLEEFIFGKTKTPAKPITIPKGAKTTAVPDSITDPAEKEKYIEEKNSAYWTTLAPNVDEYSSTMAKGIASQTNTAIKGLFWCSEATVQQLERLGDYAKSHITPNEKPTRISPGVMRNLRRVKKMSRMSERIAKGVLAGVITASGLASGTVMRSRAGKKFFGMLPGQVALVSLDAFTRVFDAVEIAGRSVLTGTRVVTCNVVSHRYGEQAAEAAHEGLSTAGHMLSAVWTLSKIRKALNPNRAGSKMSKKGMMKTMMKSGKPAA